MSRGRVVTRAWDRSRRGPKGSGARGKCVASYWHAVRDDGTLISAATSLRFEAFGDFPPELTGLGEHLGLIDGQRLRIAHDDPPVHHDVLHVGPLERVQHLRIDVV